MRSGIAGAWLWASIAAGAWAQDEARDAAPPELLDPDDEWARAGRLLFHAGGPMETRDVELHFGGRVALDFVAWDDRNSNESGFKFGALRPLIEVDVSGRTQFRAELDLDQVDSKRGCYDLWVRQELGRTGAVQVGQVRVAMGSEYATREENLPLYGYGFTSYLTGRYDLGLRATLDPAAALHLEGVATAGSGFGLEGEGKEDPLFLGRATLEPLRARGPEWLRGLFVGGALAWQPSYRDELVVATPLQTTLFATDELRGSDATWVLLEAGWRNGPMRVGVETMRGMISDVELPGGGHHDIDELYAWTVYASCFLSREQPAWQDGRWTRHVRARSRIPADEKDEMTRYVMHPSEMPIELAARYSKGDLDQSLFDLGLTTSDPSTQEFRTFSANVIFHVMPGTRVFLGGERTIADDDLSVFGGANRDTSFLMRLELDF
jgi:hypothetical protein